ncbi:hypothetical protein SLS59_008390 [Nothophoma quercina]|uniref:ATPase AAA-type core domain-containing protein n=1 Tax=Nothophoma quercina TaxID=749835 RepID=A0ABR3QTG9_9PLEO
MTLEVGELFRDHPRGSWDEWIPDNVPRNVEKGKEMRKKAFIVRRQRDPPKPTLELHSIVVHSPLLRRILDRTFTDYEGISTKLKKLQFNAPLHEFYYRWHRLVQQGEAEEDAEAKKHFELFHDVIDKEILPHIDKMQDYTTHGVVTYDYLWAIFPPGIDVYTFADEQDRIYQAVRSSYGDCSFNLECTYIDCDGEDFHSCTLAEKMKRPLYSMSAGELGETAKEVEHSVESVLELAALWDAILLLDECDIFLERRSTKEIKRNRLVAIFLRQLEYFKGVMFLTTNRASTLDAAFESRIHLTIDYPALDEKSRLHVWRTFVTGGGNQNVGEEDLAQLARQPLNGRQIKNLVKTARLLAKQDRRPLGVGDLELVLHVKMKSRSAQEDNEGAEEQPFQTR